MKGAPKDDTPGPLDLRRLQIEERAACAEGGVVHQDVDATQLPHRRIDHFLVALAVRDISWEEKSAAAESLNLADHGLGGFRSGQIVHHNVRAVPRQFERRGAADASPRSGNNRNFVCEFHTQSSRS